MNKPFLLSIVLLTILSGCKSSNGVSSYVDHDYVKNKEMRSDYFYLIFSPPVDFSYETIGIVESIGDQYSSEQEVLDQLCLEAWSAGANAIINIEHGFILSESSKSPVRIIGEEQVVSYEKEIYRGLAVKVDIDASFVQTYGSGESLAFTETQKNNTALKILTSILGSALSVAVSVSK